MGALLALFVASSLLVAGTLYGCTEWLSEEALDAVALYGPEASSLEDLSLTVPFKEWSKASSGDWETLRWTEWLTRIEEADPGSQETFNGLEAGHTLILRGASKAVRLEIRHDPRAGTYQIRSSKGYSLVPEDALWFNQYMVTEGLQSLYPKASPPRLSLKWQGYGGQGSKDLGMDQWDWFYTDARRQVQRYVLTKGKGNTVVDYKLGDSLQVMGIVSQDQLVIEAFSDRAFKQSLGPLAYKGQTGHFVPLNREGSTYYRLQLTRPRGALVGQGYGRIESAVEVRMAMNPRVSGYHVPQGAGGLFTLVVEGVPEGAVPVLQQKLLPEVRWQRLVTQGKQAYIALLPLTYTTKAGKYPYRIHLSFKGGQGTTWHHRGELVVVPKTFAVQNLKVDAEVEANTRSDAAYAEYNKYFIPARDVSDPLPLWEGAFIAPIQGRLTTAWGTRRRVNGDLTSYRHNGVDLAAPTGTPVKASNSGRVVFAKSLILTGETVIIDHGLGLFTTYLHLDTYHVAQGQRVKKGEVIGTVGSTGFSTGPHLHFTISYHRTALDPFTLWQWPGILINQ